MQLQETFEEYTPGADDNVVAGSIICRVELVEQDDDNDAFTVLYCNTLAC